MAACRPWLEAKIAAVRPRLVVTLGATAAQALLGAKFRLTRHRGETMPLEPTSPSPTGMPATHVMATVHPAAILRAPDSESRRRETARFVEDLRAARDAARAAPPMARRSRSA